MVPEAQEHRHDRHRGCDSGLRAGRRARPQRRLPRLLRLRGQVHPDHVHGRGRRERHLHPLRRRWKPPLRQGDVQREHSDVHLQGQRRELRCDEGSGRVGRIHRRDELDQLPHPHHPSVQPRDHQPPLLRRLLGHRARGRHRLEGQRRRDRGPQVRLQRHREPLHHHRGRQCRGPGRQGRLRQRRRRGHRGVPLPREADDVRQEQPDPHPRDDRLHTRDDLEHRGHRPVLLRQKQGAATGTGVPA